MADTDTAWFEHSAWAICPQDLLWRLRRISDDLLRRIEEVRLRVGQPVQLCGLSVDGFLADAGGMTPDAQKGFVATSELVNRVVQLATQASLYAVEEDLRRGYVTVKGGHRIGVAGRVALTETGTVKSVRTITSLNLRVAREYLGVANRLKPYLTSARDGSPLSALIVSPPQCGKTTLLRDLARQWSEGLFGQGGVGRKVTIVDERSEISGSVDGVPQFRLGPRVDVLDGCPKAEGMLMSVRSLSPEVLITDEIGRLADAQAVLEAVNAGVAVIASAHARSVEEWRKRPNMESLWESRSFHRYIVLSRRRGPCTIEQILDAGGRVMYRAEAAGRMDGP